MRKHLTVSAGLLLLIGASIVMSAPREPVKEKEKRFVIEQYQEAHPAVLANVDHTFMLKIAAEPVVLGILLQHQEDLFPLIAGHEQPVESRARAPSLSMNLVKNAKHLLPYIRDKDQAV